MFVPVGLALGALSSVSSLVESAAAGIAKAGGNDPLSALAQAFTGDQPPANPPPGKPAAGQFDSGTLATLISLQGQGSAGAALRHVGGQSAGEIVDLREHSDVVVQQRGSAAATGPVHADAVDDELLIRASV